MSSDQQASIQQSSSTWPEPPWSGWIETTGDALLILEAAKRGIIPRVTRRLVDSERKMITSGSVFVFDEDESGIKRWTDGFYWSPSRILGNFLLYRETDKRGAGHRGARADSDPDDNPRQDGQSLSRPKADHTGMSVDKQRERVLMGSLTNSYKFKPDGLMKKVSVFPFAMIFKFHTLMHVRSPPDLLCHYRGCSSDYPASHFVLQDRRCRKRAAPFAFFPSRACFSGHQPRVP